MCGLIVDSMQAEGIHVNMTLMFELVQAKVAGEVGATLVSPFVGRITDFYKARDKVSSYLPEEDPGTPFIFSLFVLVLLAIVTSSR